MKKFLMSLLFGIVMLMAMMPTRVSAKEITELHITCSVTEAKAGALPYFNASIVADDHASVEDYGDNTRWHKKGPNDDSWSGLSVYTPIAEKDDDTKYALRLCVNAENGYKITTSTKVYFNNTLADGAITSDNLHPWGAYVIIDLGFATDPDSGYRTVSFDNKGHGSKPSDQRIPHESKAYIPDEPIEPGYYFEGWYKEKACTTPFDFDTPITSDVKLYAKWIPAKLIPALHITGSVTAVTPGTLEKIDAQTAAGDNATIEAPESNNTYWLRYTGNSWFNHKEGDPYTPTSTEGTRYAMNLCVDVDRGYYISESTKVFYNGIEYPIDANRLYNWGAYVIIDLGVARYPVTGVTISKTSTTLKINETDTLRAIVSPDNATEKSVKWASDNNNVAKVDDYGKITAVAAGTATITVTTVDGNFTATCKVTVPKQPESKPDPEPTPTPEPKVLPFTDLKPNAWYTDYVKYVYEHGIMNGTNDGTTFEPNTPCSRAMFVTILYNAEGMESVDMDLPFDDVPQKSWYRNSVKWALKNEITKGISATKFGGNDNVSREQVATFLANYAKHKGYDTSASTELDKYPDAGKVSGWAKESVKWANAIGIVNGKLKDGTTLLDPKANATRAEVAKMIVSFIEYYKAN